VLGDTASVVGPDGRPLPGVAPVAKQQGAYVASPQSKRYVPSTIVHIRVAQGIFGACDASEDALGAAWTRTWTKFPVGSQKVSQNRKLRS
jgi:hypothetical protein